MTDDQITFELKYIGGLSSSEAEACLVSRDAIIPVVERQDFDIYQMEHFAKLLIEGHTGVMCHKSEPIWLLAKALIKSTPRQLCIALLKATGKWKEQS